MPNTKGSLGRLLPPERIAKLRKTQEEMKDIKANISMLERMGMDTSPIKEKLKWIEEMTSIMLEEFDKPVSNKITKS